MLTYVSRKPFGIALHSHEIFDFRSQMEILYRKLLSKAARSALLDKTNASSKVYQTALFYITPGF